MGNQRHYGILPGLLAAVACANLCAGELELKPETLKLWNEREQSAIAAVEQRLHGSAPFLRVDQCPDRMANIRAGEVVAWPGAANNPAQIPSGLIHDWIGAAFIPNVRIVDILAVVRDYSRYKEIYKPGVIDARLLSQTGDRDRFSMLLRNPSFFTKTALDGEFESSYIRLDDTRWYSITRAVRLQEVDDYGRPGEHKLPPDQGHGYIWRMTSVSQMEERDGGVYVEEEVLALSRDVPAAIRWMSMPVIRRVARESTSESIRKTRTAVSSMPETISGTRNPCVRGSAASCLR